MSRAFLAFNLLFIILPSILCAGIDSNHKKILTKFIKDIHGSNFKIYQLDSVNPSFCAPRHAIPYLIYGIDKDHKDAYLELWSVDGNEPCHHWHLSHFDKQLNRNDLTYTVTFPIPNENIHHGTRNRSDRAQDYKLKFAADDYSHFVDKCSR